MADTFTMQLVATLLTGSSTERTKSETETVESLQEEFWTAYRLSSGASVELTLGALTDPAFIFVEGAEGIWVKLDNTQAAHYADPYFVVSNVSDGLGQSTITIGNDDSIEHTVTVIAVEK